MNERCARSLAGGASTSGRASQHFAPLVRAPAAAQPRHRASRRGLTVQVRAAATVVERWVGRRQRPDAFTAAVRPGSLGWRVFLATATHYKRQSQCILMPASLKAELPEPRLNLTPASTFSAGPFGRTSPGSAPSAMPMSSCRWRCALGQHFVVHLLLRPASVPMSTRFRLPVARLCFLYNPFAPLYLHHPVHFTLPAHRWATATSGSSTPPSSCGSVPLAPQKPLWL